MEVATIDRARTGDPAALEAVLRELEPYLGRICGSIALDAGDDALQDAMVAIARNLGSLREPRALKGWARRIAVREAVRAARGRDLPMDPSTLEEAIGTSRPMPDGSTALEVRAVLASLGPEQRAVLVMRHVEGLGEAEMAEVLGVAKGTVKSRVHRARAAFIERWST